MAWRITSSRFAASGDCCPIAYPGGTLGQVRAVGDDVYVESQTGSITFSWRKAGGWTGLRAACSSTGTVLIVGVSSSNTVNAVIATGAGIELTPGACVGAPLCRWLTDHWEICVPTAAGSYSRIAYTAGGTLISTDAGVLADGGGASGLAFYDYLGDPVTYLTGGATTMPNGTAATQADRISDICVGVVGTQGVGLDICGHYEGVASSTTIDKPHVAGTARKFAVSATTGRGAYFAIWEQVESPPSVGTLARPFWQGYFHAVSDEYGDGSALDLRANCTVILDEPGSVPNDPTSKVARAGNLAIVPDLATLPYVPENRVIAVMVSGASAAALQAAASAAQAATEHPVLGVCQGFWPNVPIPGVDIYGIQVLPTTQTESATAIRLRASASIAQLGSDARIFLIGTAYDLSADGYSPWYRGDLLALQQAAVEMWDDFGARVEGILWYSAMLPSGVRNHPALLEWHHALYGAIPATPVIPPLPGPPVPPVPPGTTPTSIQGLAVTPPQTFRYPPIRAAITAHGGMGTEVWNRWFMDLQKQMVAQAGLLSMPRGERPPASSVPEGTLWYDHERTTIHVSYGGQWWYVCGIMTVPGSAVPVAGAGQIPGTPSTPDTGPVVPHTPNPGDGATGVGWNPTLTWRAAGASSFDVAFGTANPPPSVSTQQTAASYSARDLSANTTYYWQVVAHFGSTAMAGPVWSFTTGTNPNPSPAPSRSPLQIAGAPLDYIGVTSFSLFLLYLRGDVGAVNAWVAYWQALGVTVFRVIGNLSGPFWVGSGYEYWPGDGSSSVTEDEYYTQLTAFAAHMAGLGAVVEWVCFGDVEFHAPFTDQSNRITHARRCAEALAGVDEVLIEVANEPPFIGFTSVEHLVELAQTIHSVDSSKHIALGSESSAAWESLAYAQPPATYLTFHGNRSGDWTWVKQLVGSAPVTQDSYFPVEDEPARPVLDDAETARWYGFGCVARLLQMGATYHYEDALYTQLPGAGSDEEAAAQEFADGIAAIPFGFGGTLFQDFAAGSPFASGGADPEMIVGRVNGRNAIAVALGCPGGWAPTAAAGWDLSVTDSHGGGIVQLVEGVLDDGVGAPGILTPAQCLAIVEAVHLALGVDLGSASTREERVAFLFAAVACIHYGHPVYNPTPDPDWCVKDAGGGRPPSDDVIAKASTREAYDLITGCGADGYKFELSYVGILPAEQNIFAPPESALPG